MKIWMCTDLGDVTQSGFGTSKEDAFRYVAKNRGYDEYQAEKCKQDGWMGDTIEIDIHPTAANVLLHHCR